MKKKKRKSFSFSFSQQHLVILASRRHLNPSYTSCNKVILSRTPSPFQFHGQNTEGPRVASSFSAVVPSARKNIFLPPPLRFESYLLPTTPPLSPPASFSPFWSSRTNLYRARRCDGHANRLCRCVCVGARFGAGSILISIQSRTISSGSTFEERRVPLPSSSSNRPPPPPHFNPRP